MGRWRGRGETWWWRWRGGGAERGGGGGGMGGVGAGGGRVGAGGEMLRRGRDEGQGGDNIGVLLRGTKKEEVERGMVLAKPRSITPHTKFKAEVYVLTKEEGGRHTPFFNGYRPQFYFRTTDVTGAVALTPWAAMVMPRANAAIDRK